MVELNQKKYKKSRAEIEQYNIWSYKKALGEIKNCKERKSKRWDYASLTEQMEWHLKQTHVNSTKDVVLLAKYTPQYLLQEQMLTQCAYNMKELTPYRLSRLLTLGKHVNLYITNNNFNTNYKRISAYVESADCLALDIDYYNVPSLKELQAEEVYLKICNEVFSALGIAPSYAIDSGNGLYLFFLLDHLPIGEKDKNNRYLYSQVMNALVKITSEYGADPSCVDLSRVLRMPLTINQKTGNCCTVIDYDAVKTSKPKRYNIIDLFTILLPKAPIAPHPHKTIPIARRPLKLSNHAPNGLTLNSLGQARVKDLLHLLSLRNYEMNGKRNIFLFILALSLMEYLYDVPDSARAFIDEANEKFTVPLPAKEVHPIFLHAYNSMTKRQQGLKGYYHYNNSLIISELGISFDECKSMKTIIPTSIKYERNNTRRRLLRRDENGKTKRQQAKNEKLLIIQQLIAEGKTQTEIAEIIGVSNALVSKYKKILNETAL